MRRRLGQSLRVGVAESALALAVTSRWGASRVESELAFDAAQPGAMAAALSQLLGSAHARWPVSFVLSNDLVRMWRVAPPHDAARMADLEAAAALRFHSLYGEMPAQWVIRAGWDAARPFMAAGIPHALLAALTQAADAQGMAVTGIEPHFAVAFNACRSSLRHGAWFGLVHEGVITTGAPDGERLEAVRAAAIPDGAGAEWLATHVTREAMLLGLPAPRALALAGAVPDRWLGGNSQLACALAGRPPMAELSPAAQLALAGVVR
ncbi:hypothetical protein [Pseudoduganella sp. GCM10020061]|uniref:hypothetical protein n=1 Tax=Pseudoduganella sp. GCM10020061 TaxID=3317345 RepID=UPI00362DCB2A